MDVDELLKKKPLHSKYAGRYVWTLTAPERHDPDDGYLPPAIYHLLTGHIESEGGWRGHSTEEAAMTALKDAVRKHKEQRATACPTCDHTMQSLGYCDGGTVWHCPRCGTVKHHDQFAGEAPPKIYVPALVARCRQLPDAMRFMPLAFEEAWHRLGIAESINTPENRTTG